MARATNPALVPFPKRNEPPTEAQFGAHLPVATGKRFEAVRTYLRKQPGISEGLYFFGPKTGWAYRYLEGEHSVATVMIHGGRLLGIVALDAAAMASVEFSELSDVARQARRTAHGSPSLSWLDVPLDGSGATDFKALVKAKLASLAARRIAPTRVGDRAPGSSRRAKAPPPPPPPPIWAPTASSGPRRDPLSQEPSEN